MPDTWTYWNVTTSTSSSATTDVTWYSWCDGTGSTTSTVSTTSDCWSIWVTSTDGYTYQQQTREPTAEERAEQQERIKQKEAAVKRAKEFLIENLTRDQRATLKKHGWFIVDGKSGKKYRINSGRGLAGNVDVLADNDNQRVEHRLCAHVPHHYSLPEGDHLLAQKLMLENAEEEFLRVANRHAA